MGSRYRPPRMVIRLGTWPNNGPNRFPVKRTSSSGSHTTIESVVSPPGVHTSWNLRPPVFVSKRSTNVVLGSGNEKSMVAGSTVWKYSIKVSENFLNAKDVLEALAGIKRSLSSRQYR